MRSPIIIQIEIPSIDRFLSYLTGKQQAEIDTLTKQVSDLTQALQQSSTGLQGTVNTNQ